MGKKRIATKAGRQLDKGLKARALSKTSKKKLANGTVHVQASYNNTRVSLTDKTGNLYATSSSGALGFKGAKKGTPFAAAQVGDLIAEKATLIGVKEVDVIVKGVGAGREAAIRAFANNGIQISSIKDATPIPHNGVRPPKARKV